MIDIIFMLVHTVCLWTGYAVWVIAAMVLVKPWHDRARRRFKVYNWVVDSVKYPWDSARLKKKLRTMSHTTAANYWANLREADIVGKDWWMWRRYFRIIEKYVLKTK